MIRFALVLLFTCLSFSQNTLAQDGMSVKQEGYLQIIPEPEVEALNNKYLYLGQTESKVPGYRIQIMQAMKSEPVLQAKAKCARKFSAHKVYYTYDQPDFKLRIGDFTDRFDVYKAFSKIKKEFSGAFIVRDLVNIK